MVVLQNSDNQLLYADIVRCLKQNVRSKFQPPFVAPRRMSEFERVIITNRNYRKTIGEKSTIATYKTECSRILYDFIRRLMFRMLQLEMFVSM